MIQAFFFFKPDVLVITKDSVGKSIIDSVLYKSIKCLNVLGNSSLYFKNSKDGFVLFFKNFNPETAKEWFKYLVMCKEKTDDAKINIQQFDIGEHVPSVVWDFKEVVYRFNYKTEIGNKTDVRIPENLSAGDIWLKETE